MTLQEYYDALEKADWYYDYSDDNSVWRRGMAEIGRLEAVCKEGPKYAALYEAFDKHKFSGKPWGTEQAPKPERPTS